MGSYFTLPARRSISQFLKWYRIATLAYVGVLAFTGLEPINKTVFFCILLYNAGLLYYWEEFIEKLQQRPFLFVIDLLFICILEYIGGPYGNPYLLYTFSPLFLGGFLFGYRGSLIIVVCMSVAITAIDSMFGYGFYNPVMKGEHQISVIVIMFVIIFAMAFLDRLLKDLENAKQHTKELDDERKKTQDALRASLLLSQLSERERQVLELASEGKTTVEIAVVLNISANTVKTYLRRAYLKLDSCSKQQVVSDALKQQYDIG